GMLQNTGGVVQRAITSQRASSGKAIELSFRPLIPLILAGSALMYNQGQEMQKPGGGERNAWLTLLAESSLGTFILEKTSGVYPLLGIGLGAYRAGQQPNALTQIQAVVKTAIHLAMGYVGVNVFKGMSEMERQMDDLSLYRVLRDQDGV